MLKSALLILIALPATYCSAGRACAAREPMSGAQTPGVVRAVPFTKVTIRDRFWTPRQQVNQSKTVWHCLDMLEQVGDLENFRLAARGARSGHQGFVFNDSDVYKVIEGAAFTLATHPDPALDKRLDSIIALLASAQRPDGYLDTYYEITAPDKRFTNLRDNHELYCAGHLIEAAVAHFQATGRRNLLNIATRVADLIDSKFGPNSGHLGYGGHPELELALVKLADATHEPRYFALAEKLVRTRGSKYFAMEHGTPIDQYDGTYWLDDVPITEHQQIKGHAVRAAYLMSGTADIARETGEQDLTAMLDRVWRNATEKRVFITGGIGPSASNEGFTVDYDLPNASAYQETCASVAMAMWGERMGLLHADASYYDAVENALYNATLAGVALDGTHFFYVNPLASSGGYTRQIWFDCACCPPNALRTIASVGGYAYSTREKDLFVNLYLPGSVDTKIGGENVHLVVQGNYPWDGRLTLIPRVSSPTEFGMHLRIPGWCEHAKLSLNGGAFVEPATAKGYAVIRRTWHTGDRVELDLPMPVQRIAANPGVKEDVGRFALRRGPIVYCAEAADQVADLAQTWLPTDAPLRAVDHPELLGGIVTLEGSARTASAEDWAHRLYQPMNLGAPTPIRLVPYCDWDNRSPGAMQVWLRSSAPQPRAGGPEANAKVSASFQNQNSSLAGVNDEIDPLSSGEQPAALTHFWPHKGSTEWVAYTWPHPRSVNGVRVYWFDDTGRGECRLPTSWHLERKVGAQWVPIAVAEYPVVKDGWSEVRFPPVSTQGLRLVVNLQKGWSAGVRQWRVLGDG